MMNKDILIDEIVPYILNSRNWNGTPYQIIVAETKDKGLIGMVKRMGYCLSDYKGDNIKRYFQAVCMPGEPWKASSDEYYCCNYPKLNNEDIPTNWKDIIKIEEGRTFMLRAGSSTC